MLVLDVIDVMVVQYVRCEWTSAWYSAMSAFCGKMFFTLFMKWIDLDSLEITFLCLCLELGSHQGQSSAVYRNYAVAVHDYCVLYLVRICCLGHSVLGHYRCIIL